MSRQLPQDLPGRTVTWSGFGVRKGGPGVVSFHFFLFASNTQVNGIKK